MGLLNEFWFPSVSGQNCRFKFTKILSGMWDCLKLADSVSHSAKRINSIPSENTPLLSICRKQGGYIGGYSRYYFPSGNSLRSVGNKELFSLGIGLIGYIGLKNAQNCENVFHSAGFWGQHGSDEPFIAKKKKHENTFFHLNIFSFFGNVWDFLRWRVRQIHVDLKNRLNGTHFDFFERF